MIIKDVWYPSIDSLGYMYLGVTNNPDGTVTIYWYHVYSRSFIQKLWFDSGQFKVVAVFKPKYNSANMPSEPGLEDTFTK